MTTSSKFNAILDSQELLDKAEEALRELTVFLAGPYIDITRSKTDAVNEVSTASRARFAVYKAMEEKGTTVILGEHERLEKIAKVKFPHMNNAVIFERNIIVKKSVDAVVIFPSSPGSFLEFGDWANDSTIGCKLLVLLDQKYESELNYLNLGPALLAKEVGADVHYISYDDHDEINTKVESFLQKIITRQNMEEMYGRR